LLQAEAALADAETAVTEATARAAQAAAATAAEETVGDGDMDEIGLASFDAAAPPMPPPLPTQAFAPTALDALSPLASDEARENTPTAPPPAAAAAPPATTATAAAADPEAARKAARLAEQAARRASYEAARAEAMAELNPYPGPAMGRSSFSPPDRADSPEPAFAPATAPLLGQAVAVAVAKREDAAATAQVAARGAEDAALLADAEEDEQVREEDLDDVDLGSLERNGSFRLGGGGGSSFNKSGPKPPLAIEGKRPAGLQASERDDDADDGGDSMGVSCDVKKACTVS
jgi:hypothetical protein